MGESREMDKRELGSTGLKISPYGLGTVKFGRNQKVKYPNSFEIPPMEELANFLALAQDLGINLLDTAPAYGTSEERLGNLLKGQREKWIIVSKVGEEFINGKSHYDFTAEHTRKSVERSLKRLKTDCIDIILVHSDGSDLDIIQNQKTLETLAKIKAKGHIRSFGMSTKSLEGARLALDLCDVLMVTYNSKETQDREIIQAAHEKNKGILIKKGLLSGHLTKLQDKNPVDYCIQFIFQEPGVTGLIAGTINPEHLKQNVKAVEKALKNH